MNSHSLSSLPLHVKEGIPARLPMSYRHIDRSKPKLLTIFLHGYADHGGSFTRRLFPEGLPKDFEEIAALIPNGPFPVPIKVEDGWREAYAWYFYDDARQKMVVSPDAAVVGIQTLINELGYGDIPKVLIGFSQGGYLAPYLAQHLSKVVSIIGIGTGFRADYFSPLISRSSNAPSVHAVHGTKDEVFPIEQTADAHRKITELGFSGSIHPISGGTHVASAAMGASLRTLLLQELARLP
ncbi:MAG: hypothetical protein U1E10_04085 [Bdellovibrionales bacterium]|nr:hypothetical protein [Bdellovibrionales bacterium]